MLIITMPTNSRTTVTANPVDAAGNPTTLSSGPAWSKQNNLVTLSPPSGSSPAVEVTSGTGIGTCDITIGGVPSPTGELKQTTFQVSVVAGPLDHFEPTNTPPEPIPAP